MPGGMPQIEPFRNRGQSDHSPAEPQLLILIPCFNDWEALGRLLPLIDSVLFTWQRNENAARWKVSVLVVDDASTEPIPEAWPCGALTQIRSVNVLHLRCNLSHQRAIALGLYHAHEFTEASAVLVMDADGEDRPEDLPTLIEEFERCGQQKAVFAARTKRMESAGFQISYRAYRLIHYLLTGISVRVGNFSILPRQSVTRLMGVPDLWNHYAAAVFRAKLPRQLLPLPRGQRLAGKSRMNFVGLLIHGLSAMSVFSDYIAARTLAGSAILAVLGGCLVAWQGLTLFSGIVLGVAVQSLAFAVLNALTILGRRSATNFLPIRDAAYWILGTTACPIHELREDSEAARSLPRLNRTLMESGAGPSLPMRQRASAPSGN